MHVFGEDESCFFDPRCLACADDPFGCLGCLAGGIAQGCRFCGFSEFKGVLCPEDIPAGEGVEMAFRVNFELTVAGNVNDFDKESVITELAKLLGIDEGAITLVVRAASVKVDVTIMLFDDPAGSSGGGSVAGTAAAKAVAVVSTVQTVSANGNTLSMLLGVTVEAVSAVTTEEFVLQSPPPPPAPLPNDDDPTAAIAAGTSVTFVLILFGIVFRPWYRKRKERQAEVAAAAAAKAAKYGLDASGRIRTAPDFDKIAEAKMADKMADDESFNKGMASNWGGVDTSRVSRASALANAAAGGEKSERVVDDPAIVALTTELTSRGVDVVPWEELAVKGLFHQGTIGKLYKCQAEGAKLLMRRVRHDVLAASSAEQLAAQVAAFRDLSHPYVLSLAGVTCDGTSSFGLIEERMPRSLAALLASADGFGQAAKTAAELVHSMQLRLMTDLANGLEYLHSERIGHFSLHPENVLLDKNLQVKISDYGRSPQLPHWILSNDTTLKQQLLREKTTRMSSPVSRRMIERLGHEPVPAGEVNDRVRYLAPELIACFVGTQQDPAETVRQRHAARMLQRASSRSVLQRASSRSRNSLSARLDEDDERSGSHIWTTAVDVWAYGCLLVRLATMRPLYARHDIDEHDPNPGATLLSAIAQGELDVTDDLAAATISEALLGLVRSCTFIDKLRRPTMGQVLTHLWHMQTGEETQMRYGGSTARSPIPSARALTRPDSPSGRMRSIEMPAPTSTLMLMPPSAGAESAAAAAPAPAAAAEAAPPAAAAPAPAADPIRQPPSVAKGVSFESDTLVA